MPDLLHLRVDGISFLLGVITGTLFWALFGQFKKNLYPYLLSYAKRQIQAFRDRNFIGAEVAIRQEALKRAQRSHLAAALFPLDDVLISPKLIAPPPIIDPREEQPLDFLETSPFPFLPDWPELSSQFNIRFINLAQAMENNVNIAIVGPPGAGKTVCLAHFASLLARKDASLHHLQDMVPIYLHIQDLLSQYLADPADLILLIARTLSVRFPILVQKRVPSYLKIVFSEGRALLLLDGLDELPVGALQSAVQLLKQFHETFPEVRLVTTASSMGMDGLLPLGFQPIPVAAWNKNERVLFIQKWSQLWNDVVMPEIVQKSSIEPIDPVFVENWVDPDQFQLSPLEWTCMMWGIYSGESGSPSAFNAIETLISHYIPDSNLHEPFQKLAFEMVKNNKAGFTPEDIDMFFSRSYQAQVQLLAPGEEGSIPQPPEPTSPSKERLSFSSRWLSELVQTGFISEHSDHVYRFCHISFAGFLASTLSALPEISTWQTAADFWEARHLALGYFFSRYPDQFSLTQEWIQGKQPLYREPLSAGRWLKYVAPGNASYSRLMKRLVDGILDETVLAAPGFGFTAALVFANDPSVYTLFLQLLNSPRASVRAKACLVEGVLQDKKALPILISRLADPDPEVRQNACYAIGLMRSPEAYEVLIECLSAEDEILRQVSAVSLAGDSAEGYRILEEAAKSENLLARRSVVFGLSLIKENWAKQLLEEIAIQDGQWVVRNAASQALDIMQRPDPHVPVRLTPPSETPWLFEYASKLGQGISPGDPALDILLNALNSGTTEEQMAALDHLRLMPDEQVIHAVSLVAFQSEYPVNQAAQLALWYLDQQNVQAPASLNRASVSQTA